MSKNTFECYYCGRNDFKSARGCQQHLLRSATCKAKHEAYISNNPGGNLPEQLAISAMELPNRRLTRSQRAAKEAEDELLNIPHDADATPPVFGRVSFEQGRNVEISSIAQDLGAEANNEDDDFGVMQDDDSELLVEENEAVPSDEDASAEDSSSECTSQGPSSRGRDEFARFCQENTFFAPFTRAEEAGIKLMEVLRQKKAPINAYSGIMDWHLHENGAILEHQTLKDAGREHFIGRKTLLSRLAKRYNQEGKGPVEKIVRLPSSKEVVKIPVFDAEDKIVELLTNPRLEPKDFDFFDDDPLAPPPDDLDYIGNINTGKGFKDTYDALIEKERQNLLGVPFYIDGAVTGVFSDLPVTAVKISLTIFTREARKKSHMWATLGYLPEVKVAEGRGKKMFKESQHLEAEDIDIFDGEGEELDLDGNESDESEDRLTDVKAQDFHFMLSVILASFVELCKRGMLWDYVHKHHWYPNVHLELYIPFIRCDTEEGDSLSGKYKPRTRNVKQLCRQCYVPTMEASDHRANYKPKTQTRIEKLVRSGRLDKLREISQHYLKNAWYKCRFNLSNDRGVHGACPSEMLHAMQLGIFKYCRDIFFQSLGESAQVSHDVNGLARIYGKLLSHQSDRSLPTTNFSKGIRDGKLMARDYRGVLLLMAVVLRSTKGRALLSTKAKFREDYKKDDWLLLVELLLEWEAFLCQPTMKKKHVARLDKKHRYIMYIMKKVAKRSKGMGLNIMKFHAIVHLMEDIQIHGVPLEFDTAANESHHKASKLAAKLTQRNEAHFQMQVATRMWEFHILDLALEELRSGRRVSDYFDTNSDQSGCEMSASSQNSEMSCENSDQEENEISTDDARISVFEDEETGEPAFELKSRSRFAEKTAMNTELLVFLLGLQTLLFDYLPGQRLQIFTRHTRAGVIFHGHPNYRGQGPWKDWVVVDWGDHGRSPCHINCFVKIDHIPASRNGLEYGGIRLRNAVYAVVESSTLHADEAELGKSDLLVPLSKQIKGLDANDEVTGREFFLADTEAFVKPCAVVPDIGGPPNQYFMVKSRDDWHNEFISWVERSHKDDLTSDEEDEDD